MTLRLVLLLSDEVKCHLTFGASSQSHESVSCSEVELLSELILQLTLHLVIILTSARPDTHLVVITCVETHVTPSYTFAEIAPALIELRKCDEGLISSEVTLTNTLEKENPLLWPV